MTAAELLDWATGAVSMPMMTIFLADEHDHVLEIVRALKSAERFVNTLSRFMDAHVSWEPPDSAQHAMCMAVYDDSAVTSAISPSDYVSEHGSAFRPNTSELAPDRVAAGKQELLKRVRMHE